MQQRYIVTGAPGAGKTTVLAVLRERGLAVVGEAATDVIAREHGLGNDEPWRETRFLDAIVLLQRERQRRPAPPGAGIQLFDRSPMCTLALALHLGLPVTPTLAAEVDRVVRDRVYEKEVFLVHLLGSITPTEARRITLEQSVAFERIHRRVYRDHGFDLVEVPAAPAAERADLIERHLAGKAGF